MFSPRFSIVMDAKLLVVAGDTDCKEVRLKIPTVIGRSREVDLVIAHPLVSRRHCEITATDDGQLQVHDLGSLNGTFVGQDRVEEAVLKPGALLTVGAVTFRAVYGDYDEEADDVEFSPIDETPEQSSAMVDTQTTTDTRANNHQKKTGANKDRTVSDEKSSTEPVGSKSSGSDDDDDFDFDWLEEDDE